MKILLIGGYPPPWGGITVHVRRFYQYCKKLEFECLIVDSINLIKKYNSPDIISIRNLFKILKIRSKVDTVHFHVSAFGNIYLIFLMIKYFSKPKRIITIHSGGFNKEFLKMSGFRRKILFQILKPMNGVICVNNKQKELLISESIITSKKIKVIPAFIFPKVDGDKIEKETKYLITKWKRNTILITSGYLFEYYGYDMILDFLEKNEQYKGIFVFYTSNDPEYRIRILNRIERLQNALFLENLSPESFNWLLKNSSIYIRNTDRDGDCVALREAAFWNKKIVASNAVKRPGNVELFSFNNYNEFHKALENVIQNPNAGKIDVQENYAEQIIDFYKEIISE